MSYPSHPSHPSHLRRGRTCVFLLHAHLVFVTKYRKRVFTEKHLSVMRSVFEKVCDRFGTVLKEFNGEGCI